MRDRRHLVSGQREGINGTDTSDGLLFLRSRWPHGLERDASLSGWRLWSEHSSAGELLHVSGKMPVTAAGGVSRALHLVVEMAHDEA